MKSLYKLRQKNPKYCNDLLPSLEKNVFAQNILTVLPSRDQHGRRILLVECGRKFLIVISFCSAFLPRPPLPLSSPSHATIRNYSTALTSAFDNKQIKTIADLRTTILLNGVVRRRWPAALARRVY